MIEPPPYRGRLAPSPTGRLHLGHARTFWTAWKRSREHDGVLVLRNEDLDPERSRDAFFLQIIDDLRWLGIDWEEGPPKGGPFGPYHQSLRSHLYRAAFETLRELGLVYPCSCSRRDLGMAAQAPHGADDEILYPGTCRPPGPESITPCTGQPRSWRFRTPIGEQVAFLDGRCGPQRFLAGRDFGDFVVWRQDDVASYQLAVTVDDAAMNITEVVRGEDLLVSTARQLLIYRALQLQPPAFYHSPLVRDGHGERLAKRHASLSLERLRAEGHSPEEIRRRWEEEDATLRGASG